MVPPPLLIPATLLIVTAVIVAALVHGGFRHGDLASDVRVSARLEPGPTPARGRGWVEVTIDNPSPSTALVGLELRRARRRERLVPAADRRTGGGRHRPAIGEQVVGAVRSGTEERFWLWADGDRRRLCLVAAVGLPGRLRLHRVPLADLVPAPLAGSAALRHTVAGGLT